MTCLDPRFMGDPTVWRTSTETAQCDVVTHRVSHEVPGVQFAQPGELLARNLTQGAMPDGEAW